MARRVRDKDLKTKAARQKLAKRGKPYYRAIGKGLHLGYRKGKTARTWLLRRHVEGSTYAFETLGAADDEADADGITTLDFWQAQDLARKRAHIGTKRPGPYTVADAIAAYVKHLDGKATAYDVDKRLAANVPPKLAGMDASKITDEILQDWRNDLAKAPPRLRTTPGKKQQYRDVDLTDPEIARQRKVSANRCLSQLKRALWLARKKFPSDGSWRTAELFRGVEAARIRYLTVAEAKRLVNACEGDFKVLVQAALQTGCRYGELGALHVDDFNSEFGHARYPSQQERQGAACLPHRRRASVLSRLDRRASRQRDHALPQMDQERAGPPHEGGLLAGQARSARYSPVAPHMGVTRGHGWHALDGGRQEPRPR